MREGNPPTNILVMLVGISLPLEGKVGCEATRMRWSVGEYVLFQKSANLLCATSSVTFCDSFPSRGSLYHFVTLSDVGAIHESPERYNSPFVARHHFFVTFI